MVKKFCISVKKIIPNKFSPRISRIILPQVYITRCNKGDNLYFDSKFKNKNIKIHDKEYWR
jgi:hypothetical protein